MIKTLSLLVGAALTLGACADLPDRGPSSAPLWTGTPERGSTPASAALACLSDRINYGDLRLAVGPILDVTERYEVDGTGGFFPRDAAPMMISALAEAGARQVNRISTAIIEWELQNSLDRYLGEGRPIQVGDQRFQYRPVPSGVILGSTHIVAGSITSLDFNVNSGGGEARVGGIGGGARSFTIGVGIDLYVTDTRTSEIVWAENYWKTIIGYETNAEVFRFFDIGSGIGQIAGEELFEINVGNQRNEPLQESVRWVLENAAFDIVTELTSTPAGSCRDAEDEVAEGATRTPLDLNSDRGATAG